MFSEYVKHGFKLCRIAPGSKGPRSAGWNELSNAITTPEAASSLQAAGLLHAYSGTCAFDIDDLEKAIKHCPEIKDMLQLKSMVQIVSGNPNHAKLLFKLPEPLPSKTFFDGAFELRCATAGGKSVQDVLPPSPHPSGTTYRFVGDWRKLPTLPESIKQAWLKVIATDTPPIAESPSGNLLELAAILSKCDPDAGYDEWIRFGMAAHHESGGSEAGLAIWDEFSSPSDKYPGIAQLRQHWVSFGRSATPVTIDSLRKHDIATADEFDIVAEAPAEKKPKSEFRFLDLDELFARPAPDWLIPGVLPQRGIGSFWGQPGSGKTFLAVDIALSVALGQSWRGQPTRQGGILYIAAEDDSGVQARLFSGLATRGARKAPIRVLPTAPTLTSSEHSNALLGAVSAEGPQAITFFDTLAAVTTGADENSGKDMGQLIAICQKIHKLTNGLVILIHHEGKSTGKGLRGWSGLHGAFDVEWEVIENKDEALREMKISKLKNAPAGGKYSFQLIPVGESCVVDWL
jgi:hypothetical protein